MRRLAVRLLSTRAAPAPAALRWGAGAVFLAFATGKFRRHDAESAAFARYGIPWADVTTYLVGALELAGGILLVAGLLARPVALALAGNMAGALGTAGRIDPGVTHTILPAVLIVALAVVVRMGAGPVSLDRLLAARLGDVAATRHGARSRGAVRAG